MRKTIVLIICLTAVSFGAASGDPMNLPGDVREAFTKAGLPLLKEKRPVRDFTLKTLDGNAVTLSQLKGSVVFLNFWATWCPPCRAEMPSMEILYQRFKDAGLVFAAVDIAESPTEVRAFLKGNPYTFPIVMDTNGDVSNRYGIQAVPTTFIIDRDNTIIISAVGSRNWNTPAVFEAFRKLLGNGQ